MNRPVRSAVLVIVALAILPDVGFAQSPGALPAPEGRAVHRFPQPVRVGDLPGRKLLGPAESQPVLGRVATIVRGPDGRTKAVIRLAGWFWEPDRFAAVPIEAVALLGEHVALVDLTAAQLRGLPAFDPATASEVAPGDSIKVGLVKPFH